METLYQLIPITQPPITKNSCSIPFQSKARNADSCQHFPKHFYVAVFLPLQLCRCSCTVCCAAVLYGWRMEGASRAGEHWGQHIWGRAAPWLPGNRDRVMAKVSIHTAKMNCMKVAMRNYPGNNCLSAAIKKNSVISSYPAMMRLMSPAGRENLVHSPCEESDTSKGCSAPSWGTGQKQICSLQLSVSLHLKQRHDIT